MSQGDGHSMLEGMQTLLHPPLANLKTESPSALTNTDAGKMFWVSEGKFCPERVVG